MQEPCRTLPSRSQQAQQGRLEAITGARRLQHSSSDSVPPAGTRAHLTNVIWRKMFDSPPTAGLESSFCTPCDVLRFAVYVYRTYTPSQNLRAEDMAW